MQELFLKKSTKNVDLSPETILALYSTIYFQSKWSNEFTSNLSKEGLFFANDGTRTVTYMNQLNNPMHYYWGEDFGAVKLSLRNGSSMWFILPDEGKTVDDVIATEEYLKLVTERIPEENWENSKHLLVNLSVPRFDITSQTDLQDDLQKMGITDAFDPVRADLTAMGTSGSGNLYVDAVLHKTFFQVDAQGAKAGDVALFENDLPDNYSEA